MIKLEFTKNHKIGIYGLGITGEATYLALQSFADLVCYDDSEQNVTRFRSLYGAESIAGLQDPRWQTLDYMILSPGIPTTFPKPHDIVIIAQRNNIPIYSDIDLLYQARPEALYITVTGTNGKSTTSSLIHHILRNKKYDLGGNIGKAVLTMDQDSIGYVLEISSFQLDITHKLKSNIAVILNITPDHIDRHGSFENYILAKRKLVENLAPNGKAILSIDNKITKEIGNYLLNKLPKHDLIKISTKKIPDYGICVKGGRIFDNINGMLKEYILPNNKSLQGEHNNENIAAAYAAGIIAGAAPEEIIEKLKNFDGLPHRMQYIGTTQNIDFYNDSKATNAEAASHSIKSLENIYWLAGGVAKEGGIEFLKPLAQHIKKAYFFGEAKQIFADQIAGLIDYELHDNLTDAFTAAFKDAQKIQEKKSNILLAPACASYDQFKNYEERGHFFIKLVQQVL